MRFLSVSMENFCCIGKAEVELANKRLTVIQGKNLDADGASSNGSGKCFSPGTRVVMSDGTTKAVEAIRVGDTLVDPWSNITSVVETHSGVGDIYRVEHKDGRFYDVSAEHLLALKKNCNGPRLPSSVKQYLDQNGHVVIPVKDYVQLKKWEKNLLAGFIADAVTFHGCNSLPVCPYFVGLWLGDGTVGGLDITTMDSEVVDYVHQIASDYGMVVRRYAKPNNKAATYRLISGRRGPRSKHVLLNDMRKLGLITAKRIPSSYLQADIKDRLNLLAGILDTDGYLQANGFEVAIKDNGLSDDFMFLCRSLGFRCHRSKRVKSCQNGFSASYNIHLVTGNTDTIPTKVARRKATARMINKDHRKVGIRSVTKLGTGPYYGFQTTGSQLFMLDDFTVVHNSTIIVDSICWCLFGKTTKGGSVNAVTPMGTGKGTSVTVKFEVGDDTYELSRYRKHQKYSNQILLSKNGEDISKATASDTEQQINRLIGCNFETFLYTTILGQGMMFRFSQLTDQNRKEILEGIARTEVYEDCRVAARKKSQALQVEEAGVNGQLSALPQQVAYFERQLADKVQKQAQADAEYSARMSQIADSVNKVHEEIALEQAALDLLVHPHATEAILAMHEVVRSKSEELEEVNRRRGAAHYAHKDALDQISKLKSADGAECSFCGSALTEEHKVTELRKRSDIVAERAKALEEVTAEFQRKSAELEQIRTASAKMSSENVEVNRRADGLRNSIKLRQNTADNLRSQADALTKQDYTKEIAADQAQLGAVKAKIAETEQQVKSLLSKRAIADRWVDGFQDIRVSAVDSLMTFLNDRLKHYCSILCGDDISVTLAHNDKGKIDLNVTTKGGTYQSASGGEKDRIDICLAFSLLALARQCTQWTSNLLVLDEIAVFVDDSGVERLAKLIDLILDEVESIFLVSHNPIFAGYGDNVITVVKENGVSRIEND